MSRQLRLILGDQLNAAHHWFRAESNPQDAVFLIAELHQETHYVKHHIQKVCAFFAAMQNFARALTTAGFNVVHLTLDETEKLSLEQLIQQQIEQHQCDSFAYQQPDEWRLQEQLQALCTQLAVPCQEVDSDHFILSRLVLSRQFKANKAHRMEAFYRRMRSQFNILMEPSGEPVGGQWNYDQENRSALKPKQFEQVPEPLNFCTDVTAILKRLERHQIQTFGVMSNPLNWPVSRQQARQLLNHFCQYALPQFGAYQDAMSAQAPHKELLFHSRLSFALNTKMLSPQEVIQSAIEHWQASQQSKDPIGLAQIEGFVRQILGWREFVRGIYWANMPDYACKNALYAKRPLPHYFWDGETQMNCLRHCLGQSLESAYAHHIQRLMVIGNFSLITGLDPDAVDDWYLGVYADALEWVEMPNTRGMSQFADGGIVASKPYAGSGQYINRMSDYCQSCHYKVREKTGERACPFNSLYWHFLIRHKTRFAHNPRIALVYKNFERQTQAAQQATLEHAEKLLAKIETL